MKVHPGITLLLVLVRSKQFLESYGARHSTFSISDLLMSSASPVMLCRKRTGDLSDFVLETVVFDDTVPLPSKYVRQSRDGS